MQIKKKKNFLPFQIVRNKMCAFGLHQLMVKSLGLSFSRRLTCTKSLKSYRKYGSRTIFALSSGSSKCAVAVLRVSGPKSALALTQICERLPKQRVASVQKLYDPASKELLDKSLVLWFPGNSY